MPEGEFKGISVVDVRDLLDIRREGQIIYIILAESDVTFIGE